MPEKIDVLPDDGSTEDLSYMSDVGQIRSEMLSKLNQQTTDSEELKKINDQKHAEILEKLQSIEDLISRYHSDPVMETKDNDAQNVVISSTDSSSTLPLNNPTEKNPETEKSFVLKHDFKNVEKFENNKPNFSEGEDNFGTEWSINLIHKDNNLEFYLQVEHPGEDWEIETEFDLKIIDSKKSVFTRTFSQCYENNYAWGDDKYLNWEEMKRNYLVDGSLTAEAHVRIIETKGLRKEKFRSFDESVKEVSDIVLVVKDRKFYVLKKFLAAQSSFFKALLLGNFAESKKSELTLTGIDPEDFHFFLEVLYGELAIDESNVEGIALLADFYDSPTAIRRCEEFLLKESKKTLKKKLQMSTRYNLEHLKKKCLEEIKTANDIRSAIPVDIQDLDPTVMAELFKKSLSLMA